jgi:drug/metabolite transporter (DMT)-like permease
MLEPILNPVWVFLLHGEQPGQWAIAGGILVLSTLAMHGLASSRSAVSSSR